MNLIIDHTNLDRSKLNNELEKITSFFLDKNILSEKLEELLNAKTNDDFNKLKDEDSDYLFNLFNIKYYNTN